MATVAELRDEVTDMAEMIEGDDGSLLVERQLELLSRLLLEVLDRMEDGR